jgi:hypothetical protein
MAFSSHLLSSQTFFKSRNLYFSLRKRQTIISPLPLIVPTPSVEKLSSRQWRGIGFIARVEEKAKTSSAFSSDPEPDPDEEPRDYEVHFFILYQIEVLLKL